MSKKITIDIEVNGKMQKATLSAQKLRTALNEVDAAQDKVSTSARTADRNIKGAAQASANGTKNFSKMAQGMTGTLVPAYATVAASVFALSAAFNFLKDAGNLAALQAGQENYARRTGTSMRLLTQQLQAATSGLVSYQDAASAAAIGNAAGLTADQLTRLGAIAKNAGTTLGRDVTDSFNRLIRGAVKAEPELLDELGIIVRLAEASKEYADALDLNVNALTTFQKSQAVVNKTISEGESKFQDVGDSVNDIARLGVKLEDTFKNVKESVAEVANFMSGALMDSSYALIAVMGLLGKTILGAIVPAAPALQDVGKGAEAAKARLASAVTTGATATAVKQGEFGKKTLYNLERASKTTSSKIINYSKITTAQLKSDLQVIRAQTILAGAAGQGAFATMFASWRAQMALFRAQWGGFLGTIVGTAALAGRVMAAALSFAAWIGLAIILVALIKKAIDYFKDPKLRQIETIAKNATEAFKSQNEEIQKVIDGLDAARSPMEDIVQKANILSNFQYTELNQLLNNIQGTEIALQIDEQLAKKAQSKLDEVRNTYELLLETAKNAGANASNSMYNQALAQYEKFKEIRDSFLSEAGFTTTDIEANKAIFQSLSGGVANLEKQLGVLNDAKVNTQQATELFARFTQLVQQGLDTENVEGYVEAVGGISDVYNELKKALRAGSSEVTAQANAFKSFTSTLEAFNTAAKKVDIPDSPFTDLINNINTAEQAIQTLNANTGSFYDYVAGVGKDQGFGQDQFAALVNMLGLADIEAAKLLTKQDLITKLQQRSLELTQAAVDLEVNKTKLKTAETKAMRGASNLQKQYIKRQMDILNAEQALKEKLQEKAVLDATNQTMSKQQEAVYKAQLGYLQEQVVAARQLNDEMFQMEMVVKDSFEKGLSSGLKDFITGKQTSFKQAMADLATGILDSIAGHISDKITTMVVDFIFGKKDPAADMQNAHILGGQAAATSIATGLTTAGANAANQLSTAISTAGAHAASQINIAACSCSGMPAPDSNSSALSDGLEYITVDAKRIPTEETTPAATSDILQEIVVTAKKIPVEEEGFFSRLGSIFSNFLGTRPSEDDKFAAASAAGKVNGGVMPTTGSGVLEEVVSMGAAPPTGLKKLFDGFTGNLANMFSGDAPFLQSLGNLFGDLGMDFTQIFGDLLGGLGGLFGDLFSGLFGAGGAAGGAGIGGALGTAIGAAVGGPIGGVIGGALGGLLGFSSGGIMSNGKKIPGYATGGVAAGSNKGHLAMLHGTEAVVPLPNGKSIPVDMKGSGQQNNVVVNVSIDNQGRASTNSKSDGMDAQNLGTMIANAVQKELQNQKRSGGILNPYGAS